MSLLERARPTGSPPAPPQERTSAYLLGAFSGLRAAGIGLAVVAVPLLAVWATAAHVTAGWTQALRISASGWLLLQHVAIGYPGGHLALTPLGLTLVPGARGVPVGSSAGRRTPSLARVLVDRGEPPTGARGARRTHRGVRRVRIARRARLLVECRAPGALAGAVGSGGPGRRRGRRRTAARAPARGRAARPAWPAGCPSGSAPSCGPPARPPWSSLVLALAGVVVELVEQRRAGSRPCTAPWTRGPSAGPRSSWVSWATCPT